MSQEALLSVQMTDISIVSTLRSNHLLLRDTEIISWKVCTNNFHSQVVMHQKKKKRMSECSKRSEVFKCHSMSEQKLFKHFPIYTAKYKAKNV